MTIINGQTEYLTNSPDGKELNQLLVDLGVSQFDEDRFAKAAKAASALEGFLGSGDTCEFLSEMKRWRRFFVPSVLYGHRLGAGVSIITRYLFAEHNDLLASDNSRIVPNSIPAIESAYRISDAKKQGVPVIGFFGGSTMQGYGARLPEFTIPSLVERLLRQSYNIDAVCLNFGVAGWTCTESLHLLLHEAAECIDAGVFYDGWNCAHESFLREQLRLGYVKHSSSPDILSGTSFRHVEQDFFNLNVYRVRGQALRAFRLMMNQMVGSLGKHAGPRRRRFLNRIIQNYFSIADGRILRLKLHEFTLTRKQEEQLVDLSARDYLSTHEKIRRVSAAWGVPSIHFYQPLLPNSSKPLSAREKTFAESGLPWGRPYISKMFRAAINRDSEGSGILEDLSNTFDQLNEETFVDAGHLNIVGNLAVARRMAARLAAEVLPSNEDKPASPSTDISHPI